MGARFRKSVNNVVFHPTGLRLVTNSHRMSLDGNAVSLLSGVDPKAYGTVARWPGGKVLYEGTASSTWTPAAPVFIKRSGLVNPGIWETKLAVAVSSGTFDWSTGLSITVDSTQGLNTGEWVAVYDQGGWSGTGDYESIIGQIKDFTRNTITLLNHDSTTSRTVSFPVGARVVRCTPYVKLTSETWNDSLKTIQLGYYVMPLDVRVGDKVYVIINVDNRTAVGGGLRELQISAITNTYSSDPTKKYVTITFDIPMVAETTAVRTSAATKVIFALVPVGGSSNVYSSSHVYLPKVTADGTYDSASVKRFHASTLSTASAFNTGEAYGRTGTQCLCAGGNSVYSVCPGGDPVRIFGDTSTTQGGASAKLGFIPPSPAKEVQRKYRGFYITYPQTKLTDASEPATFRICVRLLDRATYPTFFSKPFMVRTVALTSTDQFVFFCPTHLAVWFTSVGWMDGLARFTHFQVLCTPPGSGSSYVLGEWHLSALVATPKESASDLGNDRAGTNEIYWGPGYNDEGSPGTHNEGYLSSKYPVSVPGPPTDIRGFGANLQDTTKNDGFVDNTSSSATLATPIGYTMFFGLNAAIAEKEYVDLAQELKKGPPPVGRYVGYLQGMLMIAGVTYSGYTGSYPKISTANHLYLSRQDADDPENFPTDSLPVQVGLPGDVINGILSNGSSAVIFTRRSFAVAMRLGQYFQLNDAGSPGLGLAYDWAYCTTGSHAVWVSDKSVWMLDLQNPGYPTDISWDIADWVEGLSAATWVRCGYDSLERLLYVSSSLGETMVYSMDDKSWTKLDGYYLNAIVGGEGVDSSAPLIWKTIGMTPSNAVFVLRGGYSDTSLNNTSMWGYSPQAYTMSGTSCESTTTVKILTSAAPAMLVGATIQFSDGTHRIVTSIAVAGTPSYTTLTWGTALSDKNIGWALGSIPFKLRFPPIRGEDPTATKSLVGVMVLPGRVTSGLTGTNQTAGMTVNVLRNGNDSVTNAAATSTVSIITSGEYTASARDVDRAANVMATGKVLEVELRDLYHRWFELTYAATRVITVGPLSEDRSITV